MSSFQKQKKFCLRQHSDMQSQWGDCLPALCGMLLRWKCKNLQGAPQFCFPDSCSKSEVTARTLLDSAWWRSLTCKIERPPRPPHQGHAAPVKGGRMIWWVSAAVRSEDRLAPTALGALQAELQKYQDSHTWWWLWQWVARGRQAASRLAGWPAGHRQLQQASRPHILFLSSEVVGQQLGGLLRWWAWLNIIDSHAC